MKHLKAKSGFTLMEIMVVIIVIAVLASVAGPMITSITDQGRASATKSKINSLKSAIMAYKSDLGRYPFVGESSNSRNAVAYNKASDDYFGLTDDTSILVNDEVGCDSMGIPNYPRKWKGPYMESTPDDFMSDAWGIKMMYVAHDKQVYLWSAGPDMYYENVNDAINEEKVTTEGMDDIIMTIARVRRNFATATPYIPEPKNSQTTTP